MAEIMACLIAVGLTGFLRLRMKYDRLLSWLMFFAAAFLFVKFSDLIVAGGKDGFSLLWNSSKIGDITVDFKPSETEYQVLFPAFFISLLTILHNNIFRYEEKKSSFNALIILNIVTISLLVCAENYVQLITCIFTVDILGYVLLRDVDSARRYVIYNFFADTCLFMILALVCGKLQSLSLADLPKYDEIGRHKDFVGLVAASALLIKTGCFLFQSYLLDLCAGRFQRMSAVNLLFSPLVGILVLLKLHSLLVVSDLTLPLLKIIGILTGLSGIVYFILIDNIKKKTVYLNMGFIGLGLFMLSQGSFVGNWYFSAYYVTVCFFNLMFLKIYLYQNHETKVSAMLNGSETNTWLMRGVLLQMIMTVNIFWVVLAALSEKLSSVWVLRGGVIITAAVAIVLNHIYRSPHARRLEALNPNPLRVISLLVNVSLLGWASWCMQAFGWHNFVWIMLFLAAIALPIFTKLRAAYEVEWLQKEDLSKSFFFYTLVTPLMYLSRTLWLTVDFVFSEKIITAGLTAINRLGISAFLKLNRKSCKACLAFILFGLAVFAASFYVGRL